MLSGRQLIQHHAERKHIAARIQGFASRLLGRHVGNGAYRRSRAGKQILRQGPGHGVVRLVTVWRRLSRFQLGQTEIQDLHLPGWRQENVARLDVAMQNALAVGRVQRICHLHTKVQQLGVRHGATELGLIEALAFQQFHDDEGPVAAFVQLVDSADAGMVQ